MLTNTKPDLDPMPVFFLTFLFFLITTVFPAQAMVCLQAYFYQEKASTKFQNISTIVSRLDANCTLSNLIRTDKEKSTCSRILVLIIINAFKIIFITYFFSLPTSAGNGLFIEFLLFGFGSFAKLMTCIRQAFDELTTFPCCFMQLKYIYVRDKVNFPKNYCNIFVDLGKKLLSIRFVGAIQFGPEEKLCQVTCRQRYSVNYKYVVRIELF